MPKNLHENLRTPPLFSTLVIIAGVSAFSMSTVLPVLSEIAVSLNTSYSLVQLSVAMYLAATAIMQMVVGPISDRIGRRPALLWAFSIFVLTSFGAAFADDIYWFLFWRTAQAVAGTGMALTRAIVRDQFDREESAAMISYLTMGMAIVPMFSPALGGVLAEQFGWQSIFWTQTLIAMALLIWIYIDCGETKVTSFAADTNLVPEKTSALLRSYRFWGYCLTIAFSSGCYFAYLGGASYVGTAFYDLEPAILGLYFAAPSIGYFIGNFISGRYVKKMGSDRMIFVGSLGTFVAASILLLLAFIENTGPNAFFGLFVLMAVGNGLTNPNATSGMLSVKPALAGTASGVGGAVMIGLGAGLSALAGFVLDGAQSEMPLILLMWLSTLGGVLAILLVFWRQKRLASVTLS